MDSFASYISYSDSADLTGIVAIFMGALGILMLPFLIYMVVMIIANWKLYTKAGREGWATIIPFYNNWVLFEIAGMHGALSLLLFVMYAICYINLAKVFGKDTGFAIGLILLNPIFILILAFGKDKYLGESYATILAEHKGNSTTASAANDAAPTSTEKPTDPWVSGNDTPEQPQA